MSISSVDSGPLHVKPEVDLNLSTEANRILFVLSQIVVRAKFVGVLKELIKDDGALLSDILDPASLQQVLLQTSKFQDKPQPSSADDLNLSDTSSSKQKSSSEGEGFSPDDEDVGTERSMSISEIEEEPEKGKASDTKEKRKFDGLNEVIYLLEQNPEVRKLALSLEKQLSPNMKHFLSCLAEFKNRMEMHLHESAAQVTENKELTRERYMRETYEKNEKAKKEIERIEEELTVTRTDANVCLIARNILIKRHLNKIDKVQRSSQEAIEKRVNESENAMVNSWKASMATQDILKKDLQQATEKYENMLSEHLGFEKSLRSKRSKVENQVLGWIQKFDQDIGDKQAEEEKIQGLLDDETREVNEIQKKIDDQEEEYDELMQEKALYEEEMLARRLHQFVMNRSARRIQRTFRLYKARKLAKKLAKKSKKGKKKEKKGK